MLSFILRRILSLIPVLLGMTVAVFVVMNVVPGDAAYARLGMEATPELLAHYRAEFGLDQPYFVRLGDWLLSVLRFDFGRSLMSSQPILHDILIRLPATLELAAVATLISLLIGLPLGVLTAWYRNNWIDVAGRIFMLLGLSMPNFWLALLLILWLGLGLGVLPTAGFAAFTEDPIANLRYIILPALTLGVGMASVVARFTRSSLVDVMRQDYIRTAVGKGSHPSRVLWRHALRNALIPVVTVVGMQMGTLLGGTVIVEDIFAWPGLGRFALESIYNRDYPVIQTVVLFMAFFYVVINLVVDLAYVAINPKIEYR